MNNFRLIAPHGKHVAFRDVLNKEGVPVIRIHTGAYLQRLGNLRESTVYLIENEKETDCIICEFGGVIRDLMNYLNDQPNKLKENFSLSPSDWIKLQNIKDGQHE